MREPLGFCSSADFMRIRGASELSRSAERHQRDLCGGCRRRQRDGGRSKPIGCGDNRTSTTTDITGHTVAADHISVRRADESRAAGPIS